jgi:HSP20 family protein
MAQKPAKAPRAEKPQKAATPVEVTVKRSHLPPAVRTREARHLWPMSAWEREMDRFFDDFRHAFRWPWLWGRERWPSVKTDVGLPAVDVYEKDEEVVIKADIPGLTKDDIQVELTESILTIKGEKRKEDEIKEEDYYRCERALGSFLRTVELPATVRPEQAQATFKDAVLEVRLPKTEEARRKTIKVEVKQG